MDILRGAIILQSITSIADYPKIGYVIDLFFGPSHQFGYFFWYPVIGAGSMRVRFLEIIFAQAIV
jgi:hypothetical protein